MFDAYERPHQRLAIDGMLGLFAGSGVGVAAHNLGVTEYGVENNKDAVATREAAGFLTPYRDAWDIHKPRELGLSFNALWGSPPCQTYSAAGKGKGREALDTVIRAVHDRRFTSIDLLRELGDEVGDERTALVLTPLAYIFEYQPVYVALEQVPTVLPVWGEYATVLREWGYSVWTGYLHSEQYGVPQTRKRAYLIARRDGLEATPPTSTHSKYYPHNPTKLDEGVEKWVSMYEGLDAAILQGYPRAWGLTNQPSPTITSHLGVTRSPSGTQRVYLDAIERGEFQFRPVPPKPSTVAENGIGSKFAPNTVNIETEEGGVLQGYPRGFPFQGSKTSKHLQVGNAVPPPVAEAVLRTFMKEGSNV